jgi:hypothetical protein
MVLWNWTGDLGSGKTLGTVLFARSLSKIEPVLSNFKINFPNCSLVEPQQLITMKYEKALVILDEAYGWLESRVSSSKVNRYMSYVLFQSRKRGLDIMLTEQVPSSIDLRFEYLYQMIVNCEEVPKGFRYTFIPRRHEPKSFFFPLDYAEKLYDKYETLELVEPLGMEEIGEEIGIMANPKKANEKINEIVEKAKELPLITHATVSDFMFQHEYPQVLESFVYARLKVQQQQHKQKRN